MSTLLEAAKTLIKVLELEKSQIVLSMTSGRALEQLEQAIAQEQRNKNAVPLDMVRFGGRCNIHPLNILPCTACEEFIQWRLNVPKQHSQFGSPEMQSLIIANLAYQTASTKPVVSQETAGTVDKDCDTCKYSHEPANSAVCTDCKHAYTSADHWEPKP